VIAYLYSDFRFDLDFLLLLFCGWFYGGLIISTSASGSSSFSETISGLVTLVWFLDFFCGTVVSFFYSEAAMQICSIVSGFLAESSSQLKLNLL
jgi:hypothetical protein